MADGSSEIEPCFSAGVLRVVARQYLGHRIQQLLKKNQELVKKLLELFPSCGMMKPSKNLDLAVLGHCEACRKFHAPEPEYFTGLICQDSRLCIC
jgi:hypothetical protein